MTTETAECRNCDMPIEQTEHGPWVHKILGVTFCTSQFPETVYNNWDTRVAYPKENP